MHHDLSTPELMKEPTFTVLVVDDQPSNIQLIYQLLKDDYEILMATSGQQAISVCQQHRPDLILMDVIMPDMSGWEACRVLKNTSEIGNTPVMFITALTGEDDENACWDAGAVDFLTKPINANTLKHRVKAHLTLKHQSDLLRSLAYMDGLTGISSRRHFDQYMEAQVAQAFRKQTPLSVLLLDIDYFKQYNDRFGHLAGDDCLRHVAKVIKSCTLRPTDLCARYGGEEFVMVLPDTDQNGLTHIAQRLKQTLEDSAVSHPCSPTELLTVSAGGATYLPTKTMCSAEQLLILADTLLYQAKAQGRNQSCNAILEA